MVNLPLYNDGGRGKGGGGAEHLRHVASANTRAVLHLLATISAAASAGSKARNQTGAGRALLSGEM